VLLHLFKKLILILQELTEKIKMFCACNEQEETDNKILNLREMANSETKTESNENTKVDNQ